jgi:hypothetical protein
MRRATVSSADPEDAGSPKHRVGTERILSAMLDATSVHAYATSKGEAIEWIGQDARGRELRIIAVVDHDDPDTLWIIHAQPTTYLRNEPANQSEHDHGEPAGSDR